MTSKKSLMVLLILLLIINTSPIVKGASRGVKLSTPFPSVELNVAQKTVFKIKVQNTGESGNYYDLAVTSPEGWSTNIKTAALIIKTLYLEAGENRELDFEITPPTEAKAGIYNFTIKASNKEGSAQDSLVLSVELPQKIIQSGISLSTPFPSIEGASGESFEFRLNVINKNNYGTIIYFTANYPQGWSISLKPEYQTSSIRSLDFFANENQVVIATISSPTGANPGTYDIEIVAEADQFKETIPLSVYIVGKYAVSLSPSNNLLSFDAIQGNPQPFNFFVNNTGTAPLKDVTIFSNKPEGWDLKFDVTSIPELPASSFKEIRAVLTAPKDTIPGDYLVTVYSSVYERGLSANLYYRVTVKGSMAWGYLGIGIIVVLITVVILIYWRLGRR